MVRAARQNVKERHCRASSVDKIESASLGPMPCTEVYGHGPAPEPGHASACARTAAVSASAAASSALSSARASARVPVRGECASAIARWKHLRPAAGAVWRFAKRPALSDALGRLGAAIKRT